ncbi:MAG: hypothetical protein JST49_07880 [Bacteroidetes bacterium]|nr:hypothetical protein [Bacteroidota bacterium]
MASIASPFGTIPLQRICVVVLHAQNTDEMLEETVASIERQGYDNQLLSTYVIGAQPKGTYGHILWVEANVDSFPQKLYGVLDASDAQLFVMLHSGDTFFDSTFRSVNDIFGSIDRIDWLTGIETLSTPSGYKVVHGNTSTRRWSSHILRKNLYQSGYRYIPAGATFWRRTLWDKVKRELNFVSVGQVHADLWQAFMPHAMLHPCDVYFSSTIAAEPQLAPSSYNAPLPIEKAWPYRLAEYLYLNNIPYLRSFYRYANALPQVVRFDHKTESYFLSDY